MKVVQINTTVNSGSTGRIAEDIGKVLIDQGHQSYIAFGRANGKSASQLIQVGNQADIYMHGIKSLVLDKHGFGSANATRKLLTRLDDVRPDAIGLHNIHGYYLNVKLLFDWIRKRDIPTIWTLHDCWPFTGHCAHFDFVGCMKWKIHCEKCPLTNRYPKSLGLDNSWSNFEIKRGLFTGLNNLRIVTPSQWLKDHVASSFLNHYEVTVIPNGVDTERFTVLPSEGSRDNSSKVILGVASTWDRIKGLGDFIKLRSILSEKYKIVLIGLNQRQISSLPEGIMGLSRTNSIEELVKWYNRADVFVNPTYVDNFPTTNLEALACGTPVITYNAGGSPESIDEKTGRVVNKGDVNAIADAIESILGHGKGSYQSLCRRRALKNYEKQERYRDYLNLYNDLGSNAI